LDELKKSGFFTDRYLKEQKNFFVRMDEQFKAFPEYDGPPTFRYHEEMRFSFDYKHLRSVLDNKKVNSIYFHNDSTATVIIKFINGDKIEYAKIKEIDNWKIDRILLPHVCP